MIAMLIVSPLGTVDTPQPPCHIQTNFGVSTLPKDAMRDGESAYS